MVCFLIGVLFLTGCAAESPAEVETNCVIVPAQKESGGIEISQANLSSCPGFEAKEYTSPASLSAMIEGVTGQLPSSINACFAIFNVSHGNMTNMLYVKNGWALLNLPVEVFTPWEGDRFLVGSPDSVAKMATIDGDTVIIDGGITNIRQDGAVVDMIDWSTVSGGVYIKQVRFESSRMKFDVTGARYWTATCDGKTFAGDQLEQALACGRGE